MTTDVASRNLGIAKEWIARFNAHDVAALVELYASDARHTSPRIQKLHPETGGYLTGRDALTTWWTEANRATPGLRYEPVAYYATYDGHGVVVEYIRHAPGQDPSHVAERFTFNDSGQIRSSQVYLG